jgi:hypothetical protein
MYIYTSVCVLFIPFIRFVLARAYNTGIPAIFFSGIQIPVLIQKYRFFGTNLKIIVYELRA